MSLDPLGGLPPHPPGDEQFVLRWDAGRKMWVRCYFVNGYPLERRWTVAPPYEQYQFTSKEMARLRAYRQAIAIDHVWNEGFPPAPTLRPAIDPPSD